MTDKKVILKDLLAGKTDIGCFIHQFKPFVADIPDGYTREDLMDAEISQAVIDEYIRQDLTNELPYLNCFFDPETNTIDLIPGNYCTYKEWKAAEK